MSDPRIPHPLRPHDLVWIDEPRTLISETPTPAWVFAALDSEPVAVVRRGRAAEGLIPVGIRGAARNERFAGAVSLGSVTKRVEPGDLLIDRHEPTAARFATIPALRGFLAVEVALAGLAWPWGPVGSVGFELATGRPTATVSSDLDLVVYAEQPIAEQVGRELLRTVDAVDGTADIQVETPQGCFSLREYCNGRSLLRRLKTCDGSRLVRDPWRITEGDLQ
ncbi:phosphoribosyl-dephospho-CoA transferase [Rhodopseudomonas rhenobacensis]|uniref:Phosphoribosyl-dephospho-CoA transferase n=1 Tax=Rhodopseudomonas rhenobacensis TaxID=87461 RepID=A0A7W7Z1J3_9BRAD|nr:malonate decarboxylase holo-ACP synthase [Rhodopseudomonas rhenobacensis]MBB5046213.1 phosphoribosyl-dephospho-CoA transferase [Rhodopseudomonas rhenobacensis]